MKCNIYIGIVTFLVIFIAPLNAQNSQVIEQSETFKGSSEGTTKSRSLRISITVDSPEFLKVKEGEEIKEGDVLADNSNERDRYDKQRKALKLQIDNLLQKEMPKPFDPKNTPPINTLPKGDFLEEESKISQAQLRLQQAQSLLNSRSQTLKQENPQRRAETEKAESEVRNAREKVREQEELIKSMQDLKLQTSILRHEEVKLTQLKSEAEQAESNYQKELAITQNSNITQNQDIQNLQIAAQLAQSDLQIASSQLSKAQSDRKLLEYEASIKNAQRIEEENRSKQLHSQQISQYAQNLRDRDYQISQLKLNLTSIEDKIATLPIVRSPKNGYIRRIKPWTGNNGKYSTVVTISSNSESKRKILRGKRDRTKSTRARSTTNQQKE
jgi:hypothetical protein